MKLFDFKAENKKLKREVRNLKKLCEKKDKFFKELMSDAMRHGSKLGAKHMSDRKNYLRGK